MKTDRTMNDYMDPSLTNEQCAAAILDAAKRRYLPLSTLYPLVLQEVVRMRRHGVRVVENEAKLARAPRRTFDGAGQVLEELRAYDSMPQWQKLLEHSFRVTRGGQIVTWGRATVAEHLERADALCRQAGSLAETATMHRQAAHELTAAGVDCLDDLMMVGAA